MIKQKTSPYGLFDFYEFYVVFHLSCDYLTKQIAKEILIETETFFGGARYVFISHRIASSSIDPEAYAVINSEHLVGVAIVSEDKQVQFDAINEKLLYDGAFRYFKTLEAAEEWVIDVISGLD